MSNRNLEDVIQLLQSIRQEQQLSYSSMRRLTAEQRNRFSLRSRILRTILHYKDVAQTTVGQWIWQLSMLLGIVNYDFCEDMEFVSLIFVASQQIS